MNTSHSSDNFFKHRINAERLWQSLIEMARIGATEKGGCNRPAASDLDRQGRDLFVKWCVAAGCNVTVDAFGNLFARRPGRDNSLPAICTGSHLDTQPTGGKFDGVFGVLAGVEVLRTLHEHNITTQAPIEVSVWTNEEGSRFQPAMQGSGVYSGRFQLDEELDKRDINGARLGDELAKIGYLGTEKVGGRNIGRFYETHIEQGPILEDENKLIGVVRLGQGIRWYDVEITGRESHAGSTPMHLRADALAASANIVCEIEALALRSQPGAVATTGFMQVFPNSRNTIPGSVKFSVDLRNPDPDILAGMDQEFQSYCVQLAEQRSLNIDVDHFWYFAPVTFDNSDAVQTAAKNLGYSHMDIYAGAGHDACYMADLVPTAMIFTPCKGGISHNEAESTTIEQCRAGCNVLLHAMLADAQVV
ncbi:MAG: Zn-dependent hydrolase [Pseudomonadales bacterium]|nr:Zn-dependent hydrolase [Pseudomonadales bacterium]